MTLTYAVLDERAEIIGYYRTLKDAKRSVARLGSGVAILKMRGQRYGEGFHEGVYVPGSEGQWNKVDASFASKIAQGDARWCSEHNDWEEK